MVFKLAMLFVVVLTALAGCSAQQERSEEQEIKRGEQIEEKQPGSFPTFRYRPGAGVTVEGR
jgi:outer membrane protein assembly factor BamE (lipoprotein component of BamABCDE complex)